MPPYTQTKKYLMDAYPSLFVDEADVLHHLFFVNGNGYEWVEGQLVDVCSPEQDLDATRAQDKRRLEWEAKMAAAKGSDTRFYEQQLALIAKSPAAQRRAERQYRIRRCTQRRPPGSRIRDCHYLDEGGKLRRYLYPLCEYADILHVPDDVKSDWLKAAEKALSLVGGPLVHRPGETQRNKLYLRQAQKRIDGIKEKRHAAR